MAETPAQTQAAGTTSTGAPTEQGAVDAASLDALEIALGYVRNPTGHGHMVPGVWDANGRSATPGEKCEECAPFLADMKRIEELRAGKAVPLDALRRLMDALEKCGKENGPHAHDCGEILAGLRAALASAEGASAAPRDERPEGLWQCQTPKCGQWTDPDRCYRCGAERKR